MDPQTYVDTTSDNVGTEDQFSLGSLVRPSQSAQPHHPRGYNQVWGVSTQTRFRTPENASSGSLTTTLQIPAPERSSSEGVLLLRGDSSSNVNVDTNKKAKRAARPTVRWADDTVDNENLNKKKSKICCVFKKNRSWSDTESDESDCSSCDDHDHPNEYERP